MTEKKKLSPEAQKELDDTIAAFSTQFSRGLSEYADGIKDGTIEDLHSDPNMTPIDPEKLDDHLLPGGVCSHCVEWVLALQARNEAGARGPRGRAERLVCRV